MTLHNYVWTGLGQKTDIIVRFALKNHGDFANQRPNMYFLDPSTTMCYFYVKHLCIVPVILHVLLWMWPENAVARLENNIFTSRYFFCKNNTNNTKNKIILYWPFSYFTTYRIETHQFKTKNFIYQTVT